LVVGEHVPDRFGEAAADLDRGDLGAALAAVAVAHPLDDRPVVGVAAGGMGGFDQRPAQVVGAVLSERAAAVALAGLLDAWGEAGVAQLARAGEAPDLGPSRPPLSTFRASCGKTAVEERGGQMPRHGDAAAAPVQAGSRDGIIGREEELGRLTDFLVAEDGPTALLLEGEAGIGKTTLWKAGVEVARDGGHRVLACRPAGAEAGLSYGGLGDLLAAELEEVLSELPAPQRWALEVALLLREPGGRPPDQRAIGLALLGVLRVLSQGMPVLVAVDDAQWLDPASAGVLEFALRRLSGERVRVLVTVRVAERGRVPLRLQRALTEEQLVRLHVGPLSLGALHRLVRARLRVALPRPTLVRVHEASAGNPFYALEIARRFVERERRPEAGQVLSIPESLDELLFARLEELPQSVRDVLAVAAAASDPTVSSLAEAMGSQQGAVLGDLDAAAAAGIVELEGDRVHFSHPLFASSVYWHAGESGRRALHRRLARIAADPEERARHLALAADGPDEEVAMALEDAARHASSRGAAVVAAELADLAARSTPDTHTVELRRRRMQGAERLIEAGDLARARQILEELLPELSPGGQRADVLVLLAQTRGDDIGVQGELCRAALRDAGTDPARLARIRRQLSGVAAIGLDQRAALEEARAGAEAADASGDTRLLVSSLAYVGIFETFLGEVTPGLLERAVELESHVGYLPEYESPSMVMGYRLLYHDRLDEARVSLQEADARAAAHDDFASRLTILLHLAELEVAAGEWRRAARYAAEGYELADQLDSDHSRSALLYAIARAEALLGRVDTARAAATRGLELARASTTALYEFNNQRVLGFLELSLGDCGAAVAWLAPLLEFEPVRAGRMASYTLLPDTIEALLGVGDVAQARDLVELLEETARTLDRPHVQTTAARCRGLLRAEEGELEAALAAFENALEEHERLPNPFERARTLLALGETQRRARQRRAARQSLQAALALFEELGARLWAEKARRELARIGGRAPSVGALTPTEERVAALVAEGRTNREAANALYLSEHTVEGHLSRIYAKLGVRSRAELAHRLATLSGERVDS
jgi:DNA-binding CsgD family transcriptional regulator